MVDVSLVGAVGIQNLTFSIAVSDPTVSTVNASFAYRLVSPLFDDQGLIVSAVQVPDGTTVTTARDRYGRQTASGTFI